MFKVCGILLVYQISLSSAVVSSQVLRSGAHKSGISKHHETALKCCEASGCHLPANYGNEMKVATYCKFHYLDGQLRILTSKNRRCVFPEGCGRIATCGDPLVRKARFCARHKVKGCLNLTSRKCQQPGCSGYASYCDNERKDRTSARRDFCGKHQKSRPKCQHTAGCKRQPAFGDEEENIRRFCSWHKRQSDTYLGRRRKCEFLNCSTTPTFGLPGDSFPRFCKHHRQEQHVPVSYSPCDARGCLRRAYYANGNESASRCRQHRLASQMHIGKRCQKAGCGSIAMYTDGRTRSRRFCEQHKSPEDGPTIKRIGRRCQYPEGCNAEPSFGTREGGERLFCARHKAATHVNTVLPLCTSQDGCDKIAYYGQPGAAVPLFCAAHRCSIILSAFDWPAGRIFRSRPVSQGGNARHCGTRSI
jgi:hypothetical protein